jgi:hypothetical protein
VIRLLVGPAGLIIHDVDEATWLVLQEPYALCIVEVWDSGDEAGDTLGLVLIHLSLKNAFLYKAMKSFVSEVDAELVERVWATGHVLWAGKIKETNESIKIIAAEALVDMFV